MITTAKLSTVEQELPKYRSMLAGNKGFGIAGFESIATAVGTGSSNTITFSAIPSTYQHLQIRYIGKSTGTGAANYTYSVRFNGDTGSNYARHALAGDGGGTASTGAATQTSISTSYINIPNTATVINDMHGAGVLDIHDYTSTSKNKILSGLIGTDLNRTTAPIGYVIAFSGVWYATPAAITSIDIILATGNWTTTSSFCLYGIKGV